MKFAKNILGFTAISAFSLIALSACDSNPSTEDSTSASVSDTKTVTDYLDHTVEVPANPQRIIGSYLEDYLVSLNEIPVAQWTVGSGSVLHYLQDELSDVPTINYDLPYEDVLSYEPDLLLISSSGLVEGDAYTQYSEIAPTYVVANGEGVTWQDTYRDVAGVFGKEDVAEETIETYETNAKTLAADLQTEVGEKSVAVIWVTNNSAFVVAANRASGPLLYDDLGFKVPNVVAEISDTATADWSAISNEALAELDADYLFLVDSDENAALYDESVWQNIPAVANDQVYRFDSDSSWQYTGPIATQMMLDDVRKVILDAE